jgi:hypothetical protein
MFIRPALYLCAWLTLTGASAPPRWQPRTTVEVAPPPTLHCTDLRTGATFGVGAVFVSSSGSVSQDTATIRRLCVGALRGTHAVTVSDGAGGAYVCWVESGGETSDLRLQRVLASGAIASGWPAGGMALVSARGTQTQPAVCGDGSGGVWVAWRDSRNTDTTAIYVQRAGGSGDVPTDLPHGGRRLSEVGSHQSDPKLALDTSNRVWIVWLQGRSESRELRVQCLVDGAPAAGWPLDGRVIVDGGSPQRPLLAAHANGGIYAAWHESGAANGSIKLLRLTSSGTAAAPWPLTGVELEGDGDSRLTALLPDSSGVFLAWESQIGDSTQAHVGRLTQDGTVAEGWPADGHPLGDADAIASDSPVLVPAVGGSAYATWITHTTEHEADAFVTRIASSGSVSAGWTLEGVRASSTEGAERRPSIVADTAGVIVSWSGDDGNSATLLRAGSTLHGALPLLDKAEGWPDLVRLQWNLLETPSYVIRVERWLEGDQWSDLGPIAPGEGGRLVFDDHKVVQGTRHSYRLKLQTPSLEAFMPSIEIEVPRAGPLAILRLSVENRQLHATYSLPSRQQASLEMFDVQGRRLLRQAIVPEHAGEFEGRYVLRASTHAGIYFVRLTQGRERRTSRLVLVR